MDEDLVFILFLFWFIGGIGTFWFSMETADKDSDFRLIIGRSVFWPIFFAIFLLEVFITTMKHAWRNLKKAITE